MTFLIKKDFGITMNGKDNTQYLKWNNTWHSYHQPSPNPYGVSGPVDMIQIGEDKESGYKTFQVNVGRYDSLLNTPFYKFLSRHWWMGDIMKSLDSQSYMTGGFVTNLYQILNSIPYGLPKFNNIQFDAIRTVHSDMGVDSYDELEFASHLNMFKELITPDKFGDIDFFVEGETGGEYSLWNRLVLNMAPSMGLLAKNITQYRMDGQDIKAHSLNFQMNHGRCRATTTALEHAGYEVRSNIPCQVIRNDTLVGRNMKTRESSVGSFDFNHNRILLDHLGRFCIVAKSRDEAHQIRFDIIEKKLNIRSISHIRSTLDRVSKYLKRGYTAKFHNVWWKIMDYSLDLPEELRADFEMKKMLNSFGTTTTPVKEDYKDSYQMLFSSDSYRKEYE